MTDLRKDYLTEIEAAQYMCVGSTKFAEVVKQYAITVGRLGKKKLYRKTDLQRVIENEAFGNGQRLQA